MNRFSGLIKCKMCGKNFKVKKERGRIKYICSGYERFGKDYCKRIVIKEEVLNDLMELHFSKVLTDCEVRELVEVIEVDQDNTFINYKDGDYSAITQYTIKF